MSQTDRSPLCKPKDSNRATGRTEMSFNASRKKGISLSKQLKKTGKDRSASFIKLSNKGNKSFIVEKREIKLLIRGKEETSNTATTATNRLLQERQNQLNWMNQAPFALQIPQNKAAHFIPHSKANFIPPAQSNALPFSSKKKNQLSKHPLPVPPFPACTPNPKRTKLKLL